MKLLKLYTNWADEFDVYGFVVYTDEKYERWLKMIDMLEFPREQYFGTNEYLEWDTKEELLNDIEVTDICDNATRVIEGNLCCGGSYGNFVCEYCDVAEWIAQDLSEEDFETFSQEFFPEDYED